VSASLNAVRTQNAYVPEAELRYEGGVKLNLQVEGNPIYYKYMPRQRQHPRSGFFNPETRLNPGNWLLVRNCDQVAIRSAILNQPATVTIEILGPDD